MLLKHPNIFISCSFGEENLNNLVMLSVRADLKGPHSNNLHRGSMHFFSMFCFYGPLKLDMDERSNLIVQSLKNINLTDCSTIMEEISGGYSPPYS